MPELEDPKVNKSESKKPQRKVCAHRVGTSECVICVNEKRCPSDVEDVEEIGKIEGGRSYCLGQA